MPCYSFNVCVLQNSLVKILCPKLMAYKGGAFTKQQGQGNRAVVNEINAVMKKVRRDLLSPLPCEDIA